VSVEGNADITRHAAQTIRVGKNKLITTIKAGAAVASALAAAGVPVTVVVDSGVYTEDNPIAWPDYTSLSGTDGYASVRIECLNTGALDHAIVAGSHSNFSGISIKGATGAGAAGVHIPAGTIEFHMDSMHIEDCDRVIWSESAELTNTAQLINVHGDGTTVIEVASGAYYGISNVYLAGGTWDRALLIEGVCQCNNSFFGGTCTIGAHVTGGGTLSARLIAFQGPGKGAVVDANSTLRGFVGASGATVLDLETTATTAKVFIAGGELRADRVSIYPGTPTANKRILFSDGTPGDEGTSCVGEFHVGTPDHPSETCLGEGDSTSIDMVCLTYATIGGVYTDVTDAIVAGTATTMFPALAAGNAFLMCNTSREFPGWKDTISTALDLGAAGAIEVSLSDGAAGWTSIYTMTADSDRPRKAHAQQIFERIQSSQVRYDPDDPTWGVDTYDGDAGKWLKIEITSAITTAPVLENATGTSLKLHTNRFEANDDGAPELFGYAIGHGNIPLVGQPFALTAGGSPGAVTISASSNITYSAPLSGFSKGDGIVWQTTVPEGLDTSRKITLLLGWKPSSADTGDVSWVAIAVPVVEGDNLPSSGGALDESTDNQIVAASGVTDDTQFTEFTLGIPDALPGQGILISLQRIATGDTFTGTAERAFVSLDGQFWS